MYEVSAKPSTSLPRSPIASAQTSSSADLSAPGSCSARPLASPSIFMLRLLTSPEICPESSKSSAALILVVPTSIESTNHRMTSIRRKINRKSVFPANFCLFYSRLAPSNIPPHRSGREKLCSDERFSANAIKHEWHAQMGMRLTAGGPLRFRFAVLAVGRTQSVSKRIPPRRLLLHNRPKNNDPLPLRAIEPFLTSCCSPCSCMMQVLLVLQSVSTMQSACLSIRQCLRETKISLTTRSLTGRGRP